MPRPYRPKGMSASGWDGLREALGPHQLPAGDQQTTLFPPSNKGRTFERVILTPTEVHRMRRACNRKCFTGLRNATMIATLWRTGIRADEIRSLRNRDYVAKHRELRVPIAKYDSVRVLPVDEDLHAALEHWQTFRDRELLEHYLDSRGSDALFCSTRNTFLHPSYLRGMVARVAAKAKIGHRVNPHAFRHTCASELAREGIHPTVIQAILGHDNLQTTSVYLKGLSVNEAARASVDDREPWAIEG